MGHCTQEKTKVAGNVRVGETASYAGARERDSKLPATRQDAVAGVDTNKGRVKQSCSNSLTSSPAHNKNMQAGEAQEIRQKHRGTEQTWRGYIV